MFAIANGIKSQKHINNIMTFLNMDKSKKNFLNHLNINIVCKTKTDLSNMNKIKFPGYNIHRADRNKSAQGGVAKKKN